MAKAFEAIRRFFAAIGLAGGLAFAIGAMLLILYLISSPCLLNASC